MSATEARAIASALKADLAHKGQVLSVVGSFTFDQATEAARAAASLAAPQS